MNVYGEVELLLHSFLNLDLGKSECLLYVPTALPPRKEPAMLSELEEGSQQFRRIKPFWLACDVAWRGVVTQTVGPASCVINNVE